MNIKKLIDQIGGRERLDALIDDEDCRVTVVEQELLAQIALAVLDAQQRPFMYAISDCEGKAHFDECCVSAHGCDLEDAVGSLNDFREGVDDCYSIVPVYAVPPAASVPVGWKLVPFNHTHAQWAAGQKAFDSAGINKIDSVYRAMVETAPEYNKDLIE